MFPAGASVEGREEADDEDCDNGLEGGPSQYPLHDLAHAGFTDEGRLVAEGHCDGLFSNSSSKERLLGLKGLKGLKGPRSNIFSGITF